MKSLGFGGVYIYIYIGVVVVVDIEINVKSQEFNVCLGERR